MQIAGDHPYATFVGRAGVSPVAAMTTTFTTNLPDQRVQFDLSGQKLPGGGTGTSQVNVWVEFDLCHPFVWMPGENLIVDITAKSQVPGQYCRTAIGTGVPRMLNTNWAPTKTTGTTYTSGGIKLRFVFEPLYQPIEFGVGCAGTNQQTPKLSGTGSTKVGGGVILVNLSNARPNAPAIMVAGATCQDLPIFGGCYIYPSFDLFVGAATNGNGTAGTAIPVPTSSSFVGASVGLQYAVDDPNSTAAPLPFSLSNGLRLLVQQ